MMMLIGNNNHNSKKKRIRTSFKHQQLRIMKAHFQINQNPDSKDLKELSERTGLQKRVLQVWFQNSRAKQRKSSAINGKQYFIESNTKNNSNSINQNICETNNSLILDDYDDLDDVDDNSEYDDDESNDNGSDNDENFEIDQDETSTSFDEKYNIKLNKKSNIKNNDNIIKKTNSEYENNNTINNQILNYNLNENNNINSININHNQQDIFIPNLELDQKQHLIQPTSPNQQQQYLNHNNNHQNPDFFVFN